MTVEAIRPGGAKYRTQALHCTLYLAAAGLVAVAVVQACAAWRWNLGIGPPSGIWVALAFDCAHGVFYRPLVGALGYGATLYFPAHFAIQALLMRLGASPVVSGRALDTGAVVALLGGTYFLLRRCRVGQGLAAALALLLLGTGAGQYPLTTIREDALAAALNVWGIGLCLADKLRWRRIAASAILFSLAFATKQTTVFGACAGVVYLLAASRRSEALRLLGSTSVGFLTVLLTMYFASEGRVLAIMAHSVLPQMTLREFLLSPLHVVVAASSGDPALLAFLVLALGVLLSSGWRDLFEMAPLFFVSVGVEALLIYAWKGSDFNHLLSVQLGSVILIGASLGRARLTQGEKALLLAALVAAAALAVVIRLRRAVAVTASANQNSLVEVIRALPSRGTILSDNPIVPVLRGEQPFVLDAYMFRAAADSDPTLAVPLVRGLRSRAFSAVTLTEDPRSEYGQRFYTEVHFGHGFLAGLESNYQYAGRYGGLYVFTPLAGGS